MFFKEIYIGAASLGSEINHFLFMKKIYTKPELDVRIIAMDKILMASINGAAGQNVTMETESDFDSFFGS